MKLYPYQVVGAAFLASAKSKGVLLADEPGLGKTRQAIEAAALLGACRIGVVCPASAVGVWHREIHETGAFGFAEWRVASFNKAGSLDGHFNVLIVDEAHYCKNREAKRTQVVLNDLAERARRVILLTGTPTPNNPSEIWPLARACFPEAIAHPKAGRPMSYWEFVARYCGVTQNYLGHQKIVGGKNLAELRSRLRPYVLRRLKKDVLSDLPEVRFDVLPVEASIVAYRPEDVLPQAAEDVIRDALAREGVNGLRKVAPYVASYRRVCGLAKVAGVMDWVKDWFDGGGGKLVIFAHHREVIAELQRACERMKIASLTVDGSVSPLERAKYANAFNTECIQVFIGQNEAAGTAITLTGASTLLSLEPAWTPGVNDQVWQRIHRIGQKNACDIRYPTIAGSIDEDVTRALIPKQGAIDALWN